MKRKCVHAQGVLRISSPPFLSLIPALLTLALPPVVSAQTRLLDDLHRMLPADTDNTQAVASGDVDGDGDLDLLAGSGIDLGGSYQGLPNRLYLNQGLGVYLPAPVALPARAEPTFAVTLGDVDGDGDLDALIGNVGQNRLYLNDGTGTFTEIPNQLPSDLDNTYAVAMGDVDGDGDLDIFAGNFWFEQNRLYLNNGAGTFVDSTFLIPLDTDPTLAAEYADVDGDGDLDILTGNGFDGTGVPNRLYLNDGLGSFSDASTRLPANLDQTAALAVGDVEGDGDLDILAGNGSRGFGGSEMQDRLYLNNGAGFFADATSAQFPQSAEETAALELGDVDGDGDLDVLLSALDFSPAADRLYLNNGSGVFVDHSEQLPASGGTSNAIALFDSDSDDDLDVFLGSGVARQDRLYLNNGMGTFADVTDAFPLDSDRTNHVALGDLDGDGDLDAMVANNGQNRLLLNDGAGFLSDAAGIPEDSLFNTSLALGDVDGDGDLDALVGAFSSQAQNTIYRNDGAANFSDVPSSLPLVFDRTLSVALGDMDGDGDLDAFIGNRQGDTDRLLLNSGSGDFNGPSGLLPNDTSSTDDVELGDLDGDGDLDILLGGVTRLYLNVGEQGGVVAFVDASVFLPGSFVVSSVSLGDVDLDGDLDALLGTVGQNLLFLNDGSGFFSDATARLPVESDDSNSVVLGDLDGDGDLDAIVGNHGVGGQQNRLYLNDGTGFFFASGDALPSGQEPTNALALGDLDGEGDLDLFLGGNGTANRVHRNLTRQIAWQGQPRVGRPLTMDLFGSAGSDWLLVVSTGTGHVQTALGTLLLDPNILVFIGSGVLDGDGLGSITFAVPANPAIAGFTLYWQAALGVPRKLSNLERTTFRSL